MTRPRARSAATASRTTVRLTPMPVIISCSEGSLAPAASSPEMICSASRSVTSSLRLRDGPSGASSLLRWRCDACLVGVLDGACLVIVQVAYHDHCRPAMDVLQSPSCWLCRCSPSTIQATFWLPRIFSKNRSANDPRQHQEEY